MSNLKQETLKVLDEHGKTKNDILWIGGTDYCVPIDLFWELADTTYDDGYGAPKVAVDLVIVGKDFWLERDEYDGAEWWDFKSVPKKPEFEYPVERLITRDIGWDSLSKINNGVVDSSGYSCID